MAQLLIVEDDFAIRSGLARALSERGHAVASAGTATTALAMVESQAPDLLLLDLGLPDLDGMQMLRMLRAVSSIPVIVATARDDERAVVAALDAGADDYVIKPYSAIQVEARIRAVLRRVAEDQPRVPVHVGRLCVDAVSRTASLGDEPLTLSHLEFDLLLYLAERPGEVVSKRELRTQVWQQSYTGADKTVDVHLSWLRRKLGESGSAPRYLHTVRGAGVKLVVPPSDVAGWLGRAGPGLMRRELAVLVALTTSLVLIAFLVPLGYLVHQVAADRAVNAATREAESLAPVVATADREVLRITVDQVAADDPQGRPLTVFLPDGSVLGDPAPRSQGVALAARGSSLVVDTGRGREVLVAVSGVKGGPLWCAASSPRRPSTRASSRSGPFSAFWP